MSNARGVTLDGIRIDWDVPGGSPKRHALYFSGVRQLMLRGFQGREAKQKGKLAAIRLHETRDVFITGSRAEEGTGVFVGGSVEQTDLILSGNELRHAGRETSESAVYVPLP